jgi:hypothetical protein
VPHKAAANRQRQPVPEGGARRTRGRGGAHEHLPRRTLGASSSVAAKLKALVEVARSILVIIWNLLGNSTAHFHNPGADYHPRRADIDRRLRCQLVQLVALGYRITSSPPPDRNWPTAHRHKLIRLRCTAPDAVACPLTKSFSGQE